jgi:hypothetical protein
MDRASTHDFAFDQRAIQTQGKVDQRVSEGHQPDFGMARHAGRQQDGRIPGSLPGADCRIPISLPTLTDHQQQQQSRRGAF